MPGGWPVSDPEQDACARLVLACGGDFTRIFDELALDLETYVRRVSRIPFFASAGHNPLFFITGHIDRVFDLVSLCTRIIEMTNGFHCASWIAYQQQEKLHRFFDDAECWADIEEEFEDIYFWYTSPRPMLIATSKSEPSLMRRALASLDSDSRFRIRANAPAAQSGTKLRSDAAFNAEDITFPNHNPRIRRDAG